VLLPCDEVADSFTIYKTEDIMFDMPNDARCCQVDDYLHRFADTFVTTNRDFPPTLWAQPAHAVMLVRLLPLALSSNVQCATSYSIYVPAFVEVLLRQLNKLQHSFMSVHYQSRVVQFQDPHVKTYVLT